MDEVEVISVTRATDFLTGENLFSVQFGKISSKKAAPGIVSPLASVVLTLFHKFNGVAPYIVGSKWVMDISNDGKITLEEKK